MDQKRRVLAAGALSYVLSSCTLCIVVMMHHYDFSWSLCMKALMAQIPKPAHVDDSGVPYADDAKFQCPTAE